MNKIFYEVQHIIRVIKSRKMKLVGHIALMEEDEKHKILVRKLEVGEHPEKLGVDGRIILE